MTCRHNHLAAAIPAARSGDAKAFTVLFNPLNSGVGVITPTTPSEAQVQGAQKEQRVGVPVMLAI